MKRFSFGLLATATILLLTATAFAADNWYFGSKGYKDSWLDDNGDQATGDYNITGTVNVTNLTLYNSPNSNYIYTESSGGLYLDSGNNINLDATTGIINLMTQYLQASMSPVYVSMNMIPYGDDIYVLGGKLGGSLGRYKGIYTILLNASTINTTDINSTRIWIDGGVAVNESYVAGILVDNATYALDCGMAANVTPDYVDIGGDTLTGSLHIPDGESYFAGDDDDLNITHDGTNTYIDNEQGSFLIKNDDTLTTNTLGKLQFHSVYDPQAGSGASSTGNVFNATIDESAINAQSNQVFVGNKFVATCENPDTTSFPGGATDFTGTKFVNTITGHSTAGLRPQTYALTGVSYDIDYDGTYYGFGGNFYPMIIDIDYTATSSLSHQISGMDHYVTYDAPNSINQLYGYRLYPEAKGGATVGGAMTGLYTSLLTTGGAATLNGGASYYRAYMDSNYDDDFNTNLASGKEMYVFWVDDPGTGATVWEMPNRHTYGFYSDLADKATNHAFYTPPATGADSQFAVVNATGYRCNATTGLTTVAEVLGSDSNPCNLTFTGGILTGSTCPTV